MKRQKKKNIFHLTERTQVPRCPCFVLYFEVHISIKLFSKVHRISALQAIVAHLELFMAQGPALRW